MKLKKALVIFVLVAIISVCFAGCIEESPSAPTATSEPKELFVLNGWEVKSNLRGHYVVLNFDVKERVDIFLVGPDRTQRDANHGVQSLEKWTTLSAGSPAEPGIYRFVVKQSGLGDPGETIYRDDLDVTEEMITTAVETAITDPMFVLTSWSVQRNDYNRPCIYMQYNAARLREISIQDSDGVKLGHVDNMFGGDIFGGDSVLRIGGYRERAKTGTYTLVVKGQDDFVYKVELKVTEEMIY
ncbi:hypothetical protein C5S31_08720 [ANME-1 cluster archaeon GoMg2]|nr:hypothetical protein [ANME-1 cluster archaeon GoMg2]